MRLKENLNNTLIKQQDTIITNNLPSGYLISNCHINNKRLLVFKSNPSKDTCCVVICLVIDNDNVKRYNLINNIVSSSSSVIN